MAFLYYTFTLLFPLLCLLGFVLLRILYYVGCYLWMKRGFEDVPRVANKNLLALRGLHAQNYYIDLLPLLHKLFPTGFPPLLYAGPYLNGSPTLLVTNFEDIKLLCDDAVFPKHPVIYDLMRALTGEGLITSTGRAWQQRRMMVNPWFYANKLRDMSVVIVKNGEDLVRTLRFANGEPVDIIMLMGEVIQKILVDAMFSGRFDAREVQSLWIAATAALTSYCVGGLVLGRTVNNVNIWPWTRAINYTTNEFRSSIQKLIDEAVKKQANGANGTSNEAATGDFVEYLVSCGCSNEVIFDESVTMLFAGHDTVKNTISWLMYFLALHPGALYKMRREADELFVQGKAPTFDDFPKLRYCRSAFMEALRLRPPAPVLERIAPQDVTLCGRVIPKGTTLTMYLHGPMMDPRYWKEPLLFNPDRFMEDEKYADHFLPFSLGTRNCIGRRLALQEGTFLGAMIAQNFDVVLANKQPVVGVFEGTMQPKNLLCRFIPRYAGTASA